MSEEKISIQEREIAVQEVRSGEAVLLDVRSSQERAEAKAQPSVHFDIVRLEKGEDPQLDNAKKIYTHCLSGGRAGRAVVYLNKLGYINIQNFGGLSDWEKSGGTVIKMSA